jgi:hypothetical protein
MRHSLTARPAAVETEKMLSILKGHDLRDAPSSPLKHYEIATYGAAAALAGQLKFKMTKKCCARVWKKKSRPISPLTTLAKQEVNPMHWPRSDRHHRVSVPRPCEFFSVISTPLRLPASGRLLLRVRARAIKIQRASPRHSAPAVRREVGRGLEQ